MRYDELREAIQGHFDRLLTAMKERIAINGPLSPEDLSLQESSRDLSQMGVETGTGVYVDAAQNEDLLERFIALHGSTEGVSAP